MLYPLSYRGWDGSGYRGPRIPLPLRGGRLRRCTGSGDRHEAKGRSRFPDCRPRLTPTIPKSRQEKEEVQEER